MRGVRAKLIRKQAYGERPSNMAGRQHFIFHPHTGVNVCVADKWRQAYQQLKRAWVSRGRS